MVIWQIKMAAINSFLWVHWVSHDLRWWRIRKNSFMFSLEQGKPISKHSQNPKTQQRRQKQRNWWGSFTDVTTTSRVIRVLTGLRVTKTGGSRVRVGVRVRVRQCLRSKNQSQAQKSESCRNLCKQQHNASTKIIWQSSRQQLYNILDKTREYDSGWFQRDSARWKTWSWGQQEDRSWNHVRNGLVKEIHITLARYQIQDVNKSDMFMRLRLCHNIIDVAMLCLTKIIICIWKA